MSRRNVIIELSFLIAGLGLPVSAPAHDSNSVCGIGTQVIVDGQQTTMRNFLFSAQRFSNGKVLGVGLFDIRRTTGNNKSFLMSIECIAVSQKQSVLIGRILWSTEPTEIGIPAVFGVEDNGEGRKQKKRDRLTTVLGFIVGDAFTPDYTVSQLCSLASTGELTPINFAQDLQLGFDLPLINLTLGDIVVR